MSADNISFLTQIKRVEGVSDQDMLDYVAEAMTNYAGWVERYGRNRPAYYGKISEACIDPMISAPGIKHPDR